MDDTFTAQYLLVADSSSGTKGCNWPEQALVGRPLLADCYLSSRAEIGQMETVDSAASSLLAWSLRAPRVGGTCVNEKRT
jgi:hypothetical protein